MNNARINYKIFGREYVSIIIEMALGACMGEWIHIAKELSVNNGVLLYERAGINNSEVSLSDRTPVNISQQFTRLYPDMVKGLILLDPLSANDNKLKELLSYKEYKKSGVDKSANISIMYKLAKLHMGFLTKKIMKGAPPFKSKRKFSGYSTCSYNSHITISY